MARPLFHPRMFEVLGDFYPSLCTIEHDVGTAWTASGKDVQDWQSFEDLVDLPCAKAPLVETSPGAATEPRGEEFTSTRTRFHVSFPAYYPLITSAMRAVIDDVAYNITGPPEHDSFRGMTRLTVELVQALEPPG